MFVSGATFSQYRGLKTGAFYDLSDRADIAERLFITEETVEYIENHYDELEEEYDGL